MKNLTPEIIITRRLTINRITTNDCDLVLELFNSEGWLKYIGDRKIHSLKDAKEFIEKTGLNNDAAIWTIADVNHPGRKYGILTFIKRAFLPFPDLGYALLPGAMGVGFAHEATIAFVDELRTNKQFEQIMAITLPENKSSVKLLGKLDFIFEKVVDENKEVVHIYKLVL